MRTKSNYYRYIIVLLAVIIMLTITLFIQFIDEKNKVGYFAQEIQTNDILFQDLVTQRAYIEYFLDKDNSSCKEIEESFKFSIQNLYTLSNKLAEYLENNDFSFEEYSYLRQRLINYQVSYWILSNKIKNTCNSDFLPILYFFSNENTCYNCKDQAVILNHLRIKSDNHLMIFSLDAEFEGTISLLKNKYNVTNDQVTVVIGEENFYNYMDIETATKNICSIDKNVNFCQDES